MLLSITTYKSRNYCRSFLKYFWVELFFNFVLLPLLRKVFLTSSKRHKPTQFSYKNVSLNYWLLFTNIVSKTFFRLPYDKLQIKQFFYIFACTNVYDIAILLFVVVSTQKIIAKSF